MELMYPHLHYFLYVLVQWLLLVVILMNAQKDFLAH